MSGTVYAIASGKGGVGKTTTAVNLGAALAADGHEVVIVDTDLGMANLAGFLDFNEGDATLHEVLAGTVDLDEAIYAAPGDLDVVPSSTDIEAFARADTTALRDVVAGLRERYDYVLLDTGAGISHDTVLPLGLADEVILVSTPDVASVSDTAKTGDLTERVGSTIVGAVLTKKSSNILDATDVKETLGTDVLAVVPADEAVPTSIDAGRPLSVFAPTSPAALTYEALADVLTAEDTEAKLAELDAAGSTEDAGNEETTDEDLSADVVPFGDQGDVLGGDAAQEPLDGAEESAEQPNGDDDSGEADAEELLGLDPDADRQFLAGIDEQGSSEHRTPSGDVDEGDAEPVDDALAAAETEPDDDSLTDDSDFAEVDPFEDETDGEPTTNDGLAPATDDEGEPADEESTADPDVNAYIEAAESPAANGPESESPTDDVATDDDTGNDAADEALTTVLDEEDDSDEGKSERGGLFGKLSGMFR